METKKALREISNEIHKPFKKKFDRRKVLTNGKNDVWAMDLVDMSEWADDNKGYKFMLNIIDCFTRYAWCVPLKDKTAKSVLFAFKQVVDNNGAPKRIWVDEGKEFYNKDMDKYIAEKKIIRYSTYGDHKASMVERFNRTLKTWMWKEFTADQTRNWIDMIDSLMIKYNTHLHSSIGMTPTEAKMLDDKGEEKLWTKLYGNTTLVPSKRKKTKFKLGDTVRISRIKGQFEKGYLPNWSTEIFKVVKIIHSDPVVYGLEDSGHEEVKGTFYDAELMKTKQKNEYLVEKSLKTRKVNGKKQYLVKWLGYPDKFNSWVNEEDFTHEFKQ